MKAIFVGADPQTADIAALSLRLRWPGVELVTAALGREGLEMVQQEDPEVVLLHPDFTDMALASFIRELRRFSYVPLLVLGSQGDEMEVVTSLELGADDYVRLPCDLTEMMTRVWALLRRVASRPCWEEESPLSSGTLFINPATYEVFQGNQRITLTSTEFRLLHLLAKNHGNVITHQTLERVLWGEQMDSSGLVKKYVQRLRGKLRDDAREPRWIASVHGVGYRFVGPTPGDEQTDGSALALSQ